MLDKSPGSVLSTGSHFVNFDFQEIWSHENHLTGDFPFLCSFSKVQKFISHEKMCNIYFFEFSMFCYVGRTKISYRMDGDQFSSQRIWYGFTKTAIFMKIMIFHENFNLQKKISASLGEIRGWYFPGTWYYPKSCYLESFSSKALLFMKIELKRLKNCKKRLDLLNSKMMILGISKKSYLSNQERFSLANFQEWTASRGIQP